MHRKLSRISVTLAILLTCCVAGCEERDNRIGHGGPPSEPTETVAPPAEGSSARPQQPSRSAAKPATETLHQPRPKLSVPPTSAKIAFVTDRDGDTDIYLINPDGSGEVPLTDNFDFDGEPSWSPDGKRIAFATNRDGNWEIYVMNADGNNPVNLTNHPAWDRGPDWSPDGTRIVFESDRDGEWELYVMNADGGGVKRLTERIGVQSVPDWSPDSRRIAFVSRVGAQAEIWIMDADGSNQRSLTTPGLFGGRQQGSSRQPAWSPDGRKIAFGRKSAIWVMAAEGIGAMPLSPKNPPAGEPAWSLDSEQIVFCARPQYGSLDLFSMNADGTEVTQITNVPGNDHCPDWWAPPGGTKGGTDENAPPGMGS